jgi:uncharacterized protein (DUF362 family)
VKEKSVVVLQCEDIEETVNRIFTSLRPTFSRRERCLVKPNLAALKKASTGTTTHPEVVRAVIDRLRDKFTEVSIVESDSSISETAEMKFKVCEYEDVAKTTGAKLINLSKVKSERTKLEHANLTVNLPRVLFDCDYIVSVPTLKTHRLVVFTAAIKNLYGFIPDAKRYKFHGKVNEIVADLNQIFKSKLTLCLVDGIVGMEEDGPINGTPVGFGKMIGGEDLLVVDTVCSYLIGAMPYNVKYLSLAAEYLGREIPEIKEIKIIGENLESARRDFKPALLEPLPSPPPAAHVRIFREVLNRSLKPLSALKAKMRARNS